MSRCVPLQDSAAVPELVLESRVVDDGTQRNGTRNARLLPKRELNFLRGRLSLHPLPPSSPALPRLVSPPWI